MTETTAKCIVLGLMLGLIIAFIYHGYTTPGDVLPSTTLSPSPPER